MGGAIESFRDLTVWQLGMELTERVYRLTNEFPTEEKYGLTSQLRRAAASVPANVAEGHGRDSTKEYLRHLSIAVGSLCEVETFIRLAERLGYVHADRIEGLLGSIEQEGRMLRGLQRALGRKQSG